MANEFKHASVGTDLSQAEWEAVATHIADGQTTGDILYFNGTSWVRTSILFIDGGNSRVGIGKTNPSTTLHLYNNAAYGGLTIESGASAQYAPQFYVKDSRTGHGLSNFAFSAGSLDGNFSVIDWTSGSPLYRFNILTNGNVGIANTSPGYLLTMEASGGGYYSTADHQWHNSSSKRWKENIKTIDNPLALLDKLKPVAFDWLIPEAVEREDKSETGATVTKKVLTGQWKTGGLKNQMGFIAEDVMEILPGCADESKGAAGFADGYSSGAILAILVASVQELKAKICVPGGS